MFLGKKKKKPNTHAAGDRGGETKTHGDTQINTVMEHCSNKLINHIQTKIFKMTLAKITAAKTLSNRLPTIKTEHKLSVTHCSVRSQYAHLYQV